MSTKESRKALMEEIAWELYMTKAEFAVKAGAIGARVPMVWPTGSTSIVKEQWVAVAEKAFEITSRLLREGQAP